MNSPRLSHRLRPVLSDMLEEIQWEETDDWDYPLKGKVNNELVILRVNDWPQKALLTALDKDGNEIMNIEGVNAFTKMCINRSKM